jgi:hypothetical protein
MGGHWQRASITISLAQATPRGAAHPLVLAITPLAAVASGDGLEFSVARSRDARLAGPLRRKLGRGPLRVAPPQPLAEQTQVVVRPTDPHGEQPDARID